MSLRRPRVCKCNVNAMELRPSMSHIFAKYVVRELPLSQLVYLSWIIAESGNFLIRSLVGFPGLPGTIQYRYSFLLKKSTGGPVWVFTDGWLAILGPQLRRFKHCMKTVVKLWLFSESFYSPPPPVDPWVKIRRRGKVTRVVNGTSKGGGQKSKVIRTV